MRLGRSRILNHVLMSSGWNHMMLVGEMLLLMAVARVFYRRQSVDDTRAVEPEVLTINEALPDVTTTTSAAVDQLASEYQVGMLTVLC